MRQTAEDIEEKKPLELVSQSYKNTTVRCQRLKTGNVPEESQKTCFCCGKKISNCETVLLVNNYQILPNVLLHLECFMENGMTPRRRLVLFESIENSYKQWERLGNIFGNRIVHNKANAPDKITGKMVLQTLQR